jgi:hypothetical protein
MAGRSSDRDNTGHFRHFFPEITFNAMLEGEVAAGATVASAMETDLHDAIVSHINQFDIATIRLDGRADQIDHALHAIADGELGFGQVH